MFCENRKKEDSPMKKNKLVAVLLTAVCLFSFTGCNQITEKGEISDTVNTSEKAAAELNKGYFFSLDNKQYRYEPKSDPAETAEAALKSAASENADIKGFEFKHAEIDEYETGLEYELRRNTNSEEYEKKGWTNDVFDGGRLKVARVEYYAEEDRDGSGTVYKGYTDENEDGLFLGRYIYLLQDPKTLNWEISEVTGINIMEDIEEPKTDGFSVDDCPYPLSDDPLETVRASFEYEAKQDYVIDFELISAEINEEETEYQCLLKKGSELARARGWKDEIFENGNFVVVSAEYNAEYDGTLVPYTGGYTQRDIYLIRDTETNKWHIVE